MADQRPALGQSVSKWNIKDKYIKLEYLKIEVTNMIRIIKNWLGREVLQFIQTLMASEQETCKNTKEYLMY